VHGTDCQDLKQETCTKKEIQISNSIGIFLSALNKGDIIVSLRVQIEYPPGIRNKKNVFETSEKIKIDENLFVNINEFYNFDPSKSALYLIPPNVVHDLKTNTDRSVFNCLNSILGSQSLKIKNQIMLLNYLQMVE
jgi:hypothetical protein